MFFIKLGKITLSIKKDGHMSSGTLLARIVKSESSGESRMTAKEPHRPVEPEFVNEINMLEADLSRHPPPPPRRSGKR